MFTSINLCGSKPMHAIYCNYFQSVVAFSKPFCPSVCLSSTIYLTVNIFSYRTDPTVRDTLFYIVLNKKNLLFRLFNTQSLDMWGAALSNEHLIGSKFVPPCGHSILPRYMVRTIILRTSTKTLQIMALGSKLFQHLMSLLFEHSYMWKPQKIFFSFSEIIWLRIKLFGLQQYHLAIAHSLFQVIGPILYHKFRGLPFLLKFIIGHNLKQKQEGETLVLSLSKCFVFSS